MTSSNDWWGASTDAGTPLMGLDDHDLDDRTIALAHREEDLERAGELLDEATERAAALVTDGVGEGTAERGAVLVRVDAQHRLTDLQLTPKAIHLGSTARLREAVLDAYDAACRDISEQLARATGIDATFSPLDAFIEAIPEVAAVLPESLRHPPKPSRRDAVITVPDAEEEFTP